MVKNISITNNLILSNSYNSNNSVYFKYSFCQNSSISNNLVQRKYSFNVKNISISNYLI